LFNYKQKLRDIDQGFGILVSKFPKDTAAAYSLQEPNEASIISSMSLIIVSYA